MTMNKIIVVLLSTVMAFTVTVLIYNARGLEVQDSLINMFFALVTGELATMGGIQIFKGKGKKKKSDETEEP